VTQTYLSPQATIDPLTSRVASAAGRLGSNAVIGKVGPDTDRHHSLEQKYQSKSFGTAKEGPAAKFAPFRPNLEPSGVSSFASKTPEGFFRSEFFLRWE
jgi:hypothetical protein